MEEKAKKAIKYILFVFIWTALICAACFVSKWEKDNHEVAFSQSAIEPFDSKGETVYITKSGEKYHKADCSSKKHFVESMPIGKAEYLGIHPCSKCFKNKGNF
ncbi:MAG: hypothetical protein Q8882_06200 [Bacillota bacterium]|nr:hypothetical protein [Bacillota bacterium]